MFVGREQDLHRIDALLDRARDGRGRGLLLRGEAGVGKTTILQQIEPRANGFRIISLCGNDTETGLTYVGLVGLVHGLRDARGELTDRERTILDSVTGTGPPVPVEPLGVGSALLSLFSAVADRSPFLLLVDDLQFVDPTSREVLGFVFRRIANDPIAVVAAVRDSSPITGRDLGFDEVTVTGLGSDETAVLAQSTSPHPVASAVATKIATITGGNPLGVTELARQLTSAQAAGDTPLPSSPAVGSRLVKTFSEGYERLSASGQRVARVVATVGGKLSTF